MNTSFYKGRKILVTGGTGLIGRPLVKLLTASGADVCIASLDEPHGLSPMVKFVKADLRSFEECLRVCEGREIVFQLAGVKGSPKMTMERPATFFVPTVTFNVNMMEAARRQNVERYLFTSSIGVYAPAEVFYEENVWKTFPSPNDRFAGWAKRMGELQAEAYRIEYGWNHISIVRPANVYGPYDNFDPENAMVIPSLIRRALDGEDPLVVWGDGSPIRDFIHAEDVARGMLLAVERGINEPINLGSGVGITIKELVEIIVSFLPHKPKIIWDSSKPAGDKKRLMDMKKASSHGFSPIISIQEGIKDSIEWYIKNRQISGQRYNPFTEDVMKPLYA